MPIRTKAKVKPIPKKAENKITSDSTEGSTTYRVSYTKNMGDFNSLKVEASVTLPIGFSDELLSQAMSEMEILRDAVTTRLKADLDTVA